MKKVDINAAREDLGYIYVFWCEDIMWTGQHFQNAEKFLYFNNSYFF